MVYHVTWDKSSLKRFAFVMAKEEVYRMATQQQLDLLQSGTAVWNRWRQEHLAIMPDLYGADLSRADLTGVDLSRANLSAADLSGGNFQEADFCDADLSGANLSETRLQAAHLSGAHLVKSQLEWPPTITNGSDSEDQNPSPQRGDAGEQLLRDSSPHSSYPE